MVSLLCVACATEPVAVEVPAAAGDVRQVCAALHEKLPDELDGRDRERTTPSSEQTAVWGDPPLVLRCGVGPPPGFSPGAEILEVNGVRWFLRETRAAYIFTTVDRRAHVELQVPRSVPRADATAPLVDLARPVSRAVPSP